MTMTESPSPVVERLRPIIFDLYRNIHKGIRVALFDVTAQAARVDPSDDCSVLALEREVCDVARLLTEHAAHEDDHLDLLPFLPAIAEQVTADHEALETRIHWLVELAGAVIHAGGSHRRFAVHELYLELASFTSAYLAHQDMEERVIMPALQERLSIEELIVIHESIIGSMPPEELTRGLVAILPAMNVEDRCEMLGGMRASAPSEVFTGMWNLTKSVLAADDAAEVARRLGL